jgi:cardiolipin synthase
MPNTHISRLLQGGQAFFPALIRAVDQALDRVQLETYIFDLYGAGAEVAEALMRAARRGVTVQVLVDGVGTDEISAQWLQKMQQAGVQWQVFSPVTGRWGRVGLLLVPGRWRRLHRKLCVIDEALLFCGGHNVLDDFYDPHRGALSAARFDFTLMIQGPVAQVAADTMRQLWRRVLASGNVRQRHLGQAWQVWHEAAPAAHSQGAAGAGAPPAHALQDALQSALPGRSAANGHRAVLILRDNLRHRNSIERAYRKAIGQARREILIANAYFLPGGRLRRALVKAAQRGVKVTLLLQGQYEYFMQFHATRPVYGALLDAGVEIHEYEAGFLHAKVAVVDGLWTTVGSSNLDPLSLLLAREANVVVEDLALASELRGSLLAAIASHGRQVQPLGYSQRPLRQRLLDQLAYALMRLALWLMGQRY